MESPRSVQAVLSSMRQQKRQAFASPGVIADAEWVNRMLATAAIPERTAGVTAATPRVGRVDLNTRAAQYLRKAPPPPKDPPIPQVPTPRTTPLEEKMRHATSGGLQRVVPARQIARKVSNNGELGVEGRGVAPTIGPTVPLLRQVVAAAPLEKIRGVESETRVMYLLEEEEQRHNIRLCFSDGAVLLSHIPHQAPQRRRLLWSGTPLMQCAQAVAVHETLERCRLLQKQHDAAVSMWREEARAKTIVELISEPEAAERVTLLSVIESECLCFADQCSREATRIWTSQQYLRFTQRGQPSTASHSVDKTHLRRLVKPPVGITPAVADVLADVGALLSETPVLKGQLAQFPQPQGWSAERHWDSVLFSVVEAAIERYATMVVSRTLELTCD